MTNPDNRINEPVPVTITNWAPPAKPPEIKNTTLRTYVLDPAGSGAGTTVQICDDEPGRVRLAIQVIDSAVALLDAPPTKTPDASTAALGNNGLYLPPNVAAQPYEFFGPDAFWLNSLGTITRVTVVKEYAR